MKTIGGEKMNNFISTKNYKVGDLVKISPDLVIYTFVVDESGIFPYRAEVALDIHETMLAVIFQISEDIENGFGEITFMLGTQMYYTNWDRSRADELDYDSVIDTDFSSDCVNLNRERPILEVSCL